MKSESEHRLWQQGGCQWSCCAELGSGSHAGVVSGLSGKWGAKSLSGLQGLGVMAQHVQP